MGSMKGILYCMYANLLDFLIFIVLKPGRKITSLDSKTKTKLTVLCSRLNRSAKYHLEQDLKEKFKAQCIDNSCALMTTHSINNQPKSENNVLQR